MGKNFNENTRVQVPAALHLCRLGYTYLDSIPEYDHRSNIIIPIFKQAIKRLNPLLTELEISQLLERIISEANNDNLGREFYEMLSSNAGIKLIDFNDPYQNSWHITTELTCEDEDSGESFRPDITCFINGMPLAFIEVKKPNNRDGILAERERINQRFRKKPFRRFLNITQLMIFSNNQNYDNENRVPIQGAFYCCTSKSKAFFNVFREQDPDFITKFYLHPLDEETEAKILSHRNCIPIKNLPEYTTNQSKNTPTNSILTSMLSFERFLFLLRYGFAYVNRTIELPDGTKTTQLEKHIMRYQQLFASLSIRKKLSEGVRSGIIWHTQGSGKTALAYYSVKSLRDFFADRNTVAKFYFIVDRIALMEQAIDEFAARGLVVRTAQSRKELMEDFQSNAPIENPSGKPEIMVVNIQKFKEDSSSISLPNSYSTKLQRIFFIDEAHRGYNPKGSFLANLFDADKESIKIALTGTPLLREERESWRVFGNYIDTYYYDKSISDGYTLKLMREPVETVYKEKLENILDHLAGSVKVKRRDIDSNKIIEHPAYLNALIDYIIADFRQFRIEQDDFTVAAMIVCKTNAQARKLFNLWRLRNDVTTGVASDINSNYPAAADMMGGFSQSNPYKVALILHDEGDKIERKAYIEDFKKTQDIDILIVNQMLLTGFDAPRLKKLYLGRKLDGHDLLQALTRVNRPYREFKYGYVVDFVDIKENFDSTNDRYLRELNRTTESLPEFNPDLTPADAIIEDKEQIISDMKEIKSVLFNFTCDNAEIFRQEIDEIDDKDHLYNLKNILTKAKAIINQVRAFGDKDLKEKINSLSPGAIPTLLSEVLHRIERVNLITNTDHTADVSGIINVALDALEFEFRKGMSEELRIIVNDLRDRAEKVQREFEANFDHKEDKYVILADEFRKFFKKKGFSPKSTAEAKEAVEYMETVMKKIREINRRNNALRNKYKGDERFVRIHKRIQEENEKREKPIISKHEYEIAEGLMKMKKNIDDKLYLNVNILGNPDKFTQDVLALVGKTLVSLKIRATLDDRKYIRSLISDEYINQYQQFYEQTAQHNRLS
ncbi:MAG: HsdR family type I site-specific deoxyribonuclease [Muribaculaceae bacterium]|nr:HsdR family type I site-specific deoxyribonuclease [Muribaculaceae bacterium]